jgi:hypothetical protein
VTEITSPIHSENSYPQIQQAMVWWQQRSVAKQEAFAEMLRERVQQDLFALRRELALSLDSSSLSNQAHRQWLTALEHISLSLDWLKHNLHPDFVEDSLPLALQKKVEAWQAQMQTLKVSLTVPPGWPLNCAYDNWVLLNLMEELLLAIMPYLIDQTSVTLSLEDSIPGQENIFSISVHHSEVPTFFPTAPFRDLITVFEVLMGGQCFSKIQVQVSTWYFRWQPHPTRRVIPQRSAP